MKIIFALILISTSLMSETLVQNTPTTTSEVQLKEIIKKKSDFKFSILNQFEFQNYFTEKYTSRTIYTLTPEVGYKVPGTKLDLGLAVLFTSNLNQLDNYGNKMDIGEVDLKAFYPVWKNRSGTSFSTFAMINGYAFSTIDGAWEKFQNRLYGSMSIAQDVGRANIAVSPSIAFYADPNYKRGDTDFRAGIDWRANYKIFPRLTLFHKQKYRKYYKALSQYEFLAEYGMKYNDQLWSFESYVSRYSRELGKLWTLREQKDVWVNLNIGLKL